MAKSTEEPDHLDRLQDELIASDAAINDRVRRQQRGGGGGGKLNRSETVTVRLDPKLNYLCELAARAQRRTKSSFIEWAISTALKEVGIPGERRGFGDKTEFVTIDEINQELWDVEEPDRLVALAFWGPSLLTHDEQVVWKLVRTSGWFWRGAWDDEVIQRWVHDSSKRHNLIMERVRERWEDILAVADGRKQRSEVGALTSPLVADTVISSTIVVRPPAFNSSADSEADDLPF